ncbi:hypothetical protein [Acinetobacter sp. YH12025]|uniref:hypothetical protein n=1 Tax=Acinetobacter sp. YH12025 TaxID=2601042 RepID=UPI0015D1FA34|nr:hypothetical protein [Acinetobacter sp. YH12025]
MNKKCNSCRRGFIGRNGNGYSPCSCKKAIYATPMTAIEHEDFKAAMKKDLSENPLYSKRSRIEAIPEFVPPPPLVAWNNSEYKTIYPWFYHAAIYFVLGLIVGIVGCLYATGYIP